MADFQTSYQKLRKLEGYFLKDVDGITYAGISKKYHPDWSGWTIINKYPDLKNDDKCPDASIEPLIYSFYYDNYWDNKLFSQIDSQRVATFIFCQYVNSGYHAFIIVQKALKITVDGVFGKETLDAINEANIPKLLQDMADLSIGRYLQIIKMNPKKRDDFAGWKNRIEQLMS